MPTDTKVIDELREALKSNPSEFFSASVNVRWWVRGGDPGEGYTSDLFEMKSGEEEKEKIIVIAYVRTRFDLTFEPPYKAERFELKTNVPDASRLISVLLASELFTAQYPSENPPPVADILKETWSLRRGGQTLEKTFFEPFPESIASLRKTFRSFCKPLIEKGARSLLNPKRGK